MVRRNNGNELSAKRNIIVILRLVVDAHGRLESGEVVDVQGQLVGRFVGWSGLTQSVRELLAQEK